MSKEYIHKDTVVLLANLNGDECICVRPMQYKFGTFSNAVKVLNPQIGKLEFDTVYYPDKDMTTYTDKLGNVFAKISDNYTIVIKAELVGGRPPILKYP